MAEQIGSLSVKLGLITVEWDKATAKAKEDAKELQESFKKIGESVEWLADKFKEIAAIGGSLGFAELVHESLDLAKSVDDLAKSFGITISETLALKAALFEAGANAEGAGRILSSLFTKIEEAQNGNDKAVAIFEKMGISLSELKQMSPYEAIEKVAAGFEHISNQFEKTKLIKEFFGKNGIALDMATLDEALQHGKGHFDAYQESIKTLAEASRTLKENFEHLTIAFADFIAPFAHMNVVSVEQFSAIIKGMASAAVVAGIISLSSAIGAMAMQLITLEGAAVAFNLAAGKFTPTGILLFTASLAAGLFTYNLQMDEMEKAKKALEEHTKSNTNENPDSINNAVSTEVKQRQAALNLLKQQIEYEKERGRIGYEQITIGATLNKIALEDLAYKEKIATALKTRNEELEKEKDGSSAIKKIIEDTYQAEVTKAKVQRDANIANIKYAAEYQAIVDKGRLNPSFRQMEISQYDTSTAAANANIQGAIAARFNFREQTDEQSRLIELANKRLEYEIKIAEKMPQEQELLLQQYDLEAKITEYKYQQSKLGADPAVVERQVEEMRKVGKETQRLTELQQDQQDSFAYGWEKAYQSYVINTMNAANIAATAFNSIFNNLNSALDKFVETGKLSFSDLARSIILDLWKIQLRAQAAKIFDFVSTGVSGALQTMFSGTMSGQASVNVGYGNTIPGPVGGHASGGSIAANQMSMVGENGPELFIPRTSGMIVPTNNLASVMGGGPTVNYNGPYIANMSAIDTQSGVQFLAKNKQTIWASYQSANRSVPVSR